MVVSVEFDRSFITLAEPPADLEQGNTSLRQPCSACVSEGVWRRFKDPSLDASLIEGVLHILKPFPIPVNDVTEGRTANARSLKMPQKSFGNWNFGAALIALLLAGREEVDETIFKVNLLPAE